MWAAQRGLAEPCGLCSTSTSLTSPEQGHSSSPCLHGGPGASLWASPDAPAPVGSPWPLLCHGPVLAPAPLPKPPPATSPGASALPTVQGWEKPHGPAHAESGGQLALCYNISIKERWPARSSLPTETCPAHSTALASKSPAIDPAGPAALGQGLGSQTCVHPYYQQAYGPQLAREGGDGCLGPGAQRSCALPRLPGGECCRAPCTGDKAREQLGPQRTQGTPVPSPPPRSPRPAARRVTEALAQHSHVHGPIPPLAEGRES